MCERIVSNRVAARLGEVEAVDLVAVEGEEGRHLAPEASLAVEHDVGSLTLHEVGLYVVTRLATAGTAEHQHVVVEPGGPRVSLGGMVAGEKQLAGIGGAVIVARGVAVVIKDLVSAEEGSACD